MKKKNKLIGEIGIGMSGWNAFKLGFWLASGSIVAFMTFSLIFVLVGSLFGI